MNVAIRSLPCRLPFPFCRMTPPPWLLFARRIPKGTTPRCFSSDAPKLILRHNGHNDEGIVTLSLNRPAHHNALSSDLLGVLQGSLDEIRQDNSIRVVILSGAGDNCFSAGHDLKEMQRMNFEQCKQLFDKCSKVMMTIQSLPQVVVAQVQGIATAAGCQLVATCDLAVASDTARFAVSGINIGLFCSTPSVALSRNIHPKQAFHMLMTGDFITAETAQAYGLVNEVVPLEKLQDCTLSLARRIASKSPLAVRLGKDMFYQQLAMPDVKEAYNFASNCMAQNMESHDAREGIDAFVEKRKPTWTNE